MPLTCALRRAASTASGSTSTATTPAAPSLSAQSPRMPLPQPTSRTCSPPAIRFRSSSTRCRVVGWWPFPNPPDPSSISPGRSLRSCSDHAQHTLSRRSNVMGRGVAKPRLQGGTCLWPRHRHQALAPKRHDERRPRSTRRPPQPTPPGGCCRAPQRPSSAHRVPAAGRTLRRARPRWSQPRSSQHDARTQTGGARTGSAAPALHRDHRNTMPELRPCGRTGVRLGSRCGQ